MASTSRMRTAEAPYVKELLAGCEVHELRNGPHQDRLLSARIEHLFERMEVTKKSLEPIMQKDQDCQLQ